MKITTKDIIRFLPFDDGFKEKLLKEFDGFEPAKKYQLEKVLWETYDALYQTKLDENLQVALAFAKENKEKLDEGFYGRVRELTEREFEADTMSQAQKSNFSSIRDRLIQMVDRDLDQNSSDSSQQLQDEDKHTN